ncbi:PKD domain-containing protein [Ureibacillus sp. NPDC094379]
MKVGPINSQNGFPTWYKDENGLRLMLNTDPNDPFSRITPNDLPDPTKPVTFPDNFPSKAYYFLAEAEMKTGIGEKARLFLSLGASFMNDEPKDGEQIVFAHLSIKVAGLQPGCEYIVTHPYGNEHCVVEVRNEGEMGEINFTKEILSLRDGEFELPLDLSCFLRWDPDVEPVSPNGYIGELDETHPVIGSILFDQFGKPQNIFRIEGPEIGVGSVDCSTTPGLDPNHCIETKQFRLTGKITTVSGIEATRTTYTQSDSSGGYLDIFAKSDDEPQQIEVTGSGIELAKLEGEEGLYYARIFYSSELPPDTVSVVNVSDEPPSFSESKIVDFISATAHFDGETNILTITGSSSDTVYPISLKVEDFGQGDILIPEDGVLAIRTISLPPTITVISSRGGSTTVPVVVRDIVPPNESVEAHAKIKGEVEISSRVILDGTDSTGDITSYQWKQISGPQVKLFNTDKSMLVFTFPDQFASLWFELTVKGPNSTSTDTVKVEPVPDSLTVTRAEYRTEDAHWKVSGTSTMEGPGITVTIFIGDTLSGFVLSEVDIDDDGDWAYEIDYSRKEPDDSRAISIQSSAGGVLRNVPIYVRD